MVRALLMFSFVTLTIGCHRTVTTPPAATDYRKMTQAELVAFIGQKLHNDGITLGPDGPNHYKGTIKSPDGTADLPLEVTVEAERIVCLTKTPAGSTRQIITPQGLSSDLQMK